MANSPAIVSLGEPLIEFNRPKEGDGRTWLQGFGGDSQNVAIAAARQGATTGYLTSIGLDWMGDAFLELSRLGFQSGLAQLEPEAKTWRWKEHGIPLALRLDHVAFEPASFELVSAEVVDGGRSDHLPVRVVLRRRS